MSLETELIIPADDITASKVPIPLKKHSECSSNIKKCRKSDRILKNKRTSAELKLLVVLESGQPIPRTARNTSSRKRTIREHASWPTSKAIQKKKVAFRPTLLSAA